MTLRWLLGGTAVLRSDMIHASHEAASCTRLLFFLVGVRTGVRGRGGVRLVRWRSVNPAVKGAGKGGGVTRGTKGVVNRVLQGLHTLHTIFLRKGVERV